MKIDKKIIKELSDYLDEFNLTELEYTEKDKKIKVSKNKSSIGSVSPSNNNQSTIAKPTNDSNKVSSSKEITSPIIGTAYHAPEPGAKKFVEVGQKVKTGDILLIIEAMKTMNEIKSDKEGEIKKIFVHDGSPVEFGEPLILIK